MNTETLKEAVIKAEITAENDYESAYRILLREVRAFLGLSQAQINQEVINQIEE